MTDEKVIVPATTETEADKSQRDGVITGDKASKQGDIQTPGKQGDIQTPGKQAEEQVKTPEKELPLGKLGDNPRTGR